MSGTPEPDEKQKWVSNRHWNVDWKRVDEFLRKWPTGEPSGKLKNDITVTSTISTSLDSSVLLLTLGDYTYRNTEDDPRPWLVTHHDAKENKALASHITERWEEMAVPNVQKALVDTITKHIVYDLTNVQILPQMRALTCDEEGNVGVRIKMLQIWSDPRRDPNPNITLH